jgi:hypothetical protein
LKQRIDFDQIGLFGHSRGGEGMRAVRFQEPKWREKTKTTITLVSSEGKFAVTDALPVLQIDGKVTKLSKLSADLTRLTFTLDSLEYDAIKGGAGVTVDYGRKVYDAGTLVK